MVVSRYSGDSPSDKLRFVAFVLVFVILAVAVFPSLFSELVSFTGFGFISWLLIPMVIGLFFLFRNR